MILYISQNLMRLLPAIFTNISEFVVFPPYLRNLHQYMGTPFLLEPIDWEVSEKAFLAKSIFSTKQ